MHQGLARKDKKMHTTAHSISDNRHRQNISFKG
jgi:hypothetical protein